VNRLGDVLELDGAEIGDLEIEPPLDLPMGLLGKADRAGLCDALEPCTDVDPVAPWVYISFRDAWASTP
jgi:hypothetical protein